MVCEQSEATLRMLLARLSWPLRMVRWMAAREYAGLLGSKRVKKIALGLYYEWLSTRRFETEVTSGLAVLLCAHGRDIPDFIDVVRSIKKPSNLADLMLQHVYGYGWRRGDWTDAHSGFAPLDFKPRKYFEEHSRAHVPPILRTHFERLESETGFPFMRQWGFEWQRLTDEYKVPHSDYPYYFVGPNLTRSGVVGQFSQAQCDVYRSAYLRTLAAAVSLRAITAQNSGFFALDNLPLNRELLNLRPGSRPAWLEDLPERACEVDSPLEEIARSLVQPRGVDETMRPVSLHVPINGKLYEFGELFISAVLATPDFVPNEDDDHYFSRETLWPLNDGLSFGGSLDNEDTTRFFTDGQVGKVLPVCIGLVPMPFGFWHGEYMHQGMALPAAYNLPGDAQVFCDTSGVRAEHEGKAISTLSIWHDQWTPLYAPKGTTRCGMMTDFSIADLARAEEKHGLKLGWVAQLRLWKRESDFGEFQLNERRIFFFDEAA